ncbi:MAG: thioesterase family protein [Micrococcaceae bacterium]
MSTSYFERLDAHTFQPTQHTSGAWNVTEQHIAPVLGLLTHALETDRDARRAEAGAGDSGAGDPNAPTLPITRICFDILGTLTVADPMEISCRVIRPGRTIELVEAQLSSRGRVQVIARAWFLAGYDTAALAGSPFPEITPLEDSEPWDPTTVWPGDFIAGLEIRRRHLEPGRAHYWARTPVALVAGEQVSATARFVGLTDIANGMAVRVPPTEVAFPNVDLTVHLVREPVGEWNGVDLSVTFGAGGHGLTHSVLHDVEGPVGAVSQALTVRPLG